MYSPKYSISNKILKSIGEIEAAREVIENAPLVPSFEKQFQSDAVVRTVHHGTHIEGNDLTLMQTRKVLEGEAVVARARDIQEVVNYRNVVGLLDELAYKRGDYDVELLKDIQKVSVYKIVPDEKIGVFRKSQVVIKNEETGEVILHPPSFVEVPFLIEDFIAWLNSKEAKEVHPILLAGMAHYLLVAIHPFVEGNGRTARAFATLTLIKQGYDIKKFFSLEEHFDEALAQRIKKALLVLDSIFYPPNPDERKGYRRYRHLEFQVRKNPGRGFVVDVPGDSCNLYVAGDYFPQDDWGLEFTTHNVDSSPQQFLFLVALAMVCDAIEGGIDHPFSAAGK